MGKINQYIVGVKPPSWDREKIRLQKDAILELDRMKGDLQAAGERIAELEGKEPVKTLLKITRIAKSSQRCTGCLVVLDKREGG